MATTYEAIATVTVGSGGAANIEFTSIPGTYTDLVVMASLKGDSPLNDIQVYVYFNSNTSNYSRRLLYGDGSSAVSASASDAIAVLQNIPSFSASTFASTSLYIPNYAGSTNKSFSSDTVTENNATNSYAAMYAALWSNTSAITSIKLDPVNGDLVQYSSATLYGIKNS